MNTENQNKCASAIITLEFEPSIVPLDMTTSAYLKAISYETKVIGEYDYINKFSFKLDALSSEVVIFYKKIPKKIIHILLGQILQLLMFLMKFRGESSEL